jgi:hypothetical protein
MVLVGKRQPEHHRNDDETAHHQEMPYCAAIWRAFCSSVSRRLAWLFLELDDVRFPEAAGMASAGAAVEAAAGISLAAGIRLPMSLACAEAEARAKAEMRSSLRICSLPCWMKGG